MAAVAATCAQTGASGAGNARAGVDWPQFRGIRAAGVDDKHPAPLTWSVEKKQGIVWKTPIPGLGLASPVVWGDSVYLATAISGKTDSKLRIGYYGDIASVADETSHEWADLLSRQEDRRDQVAADRGHRYPEDQAARKIHTRQLDARHGRSTPHRVLRLGRPLRLRHERQAALEEGPLASSTAGSSWSPLRSGRPAAHPILHNDVAVVQADVQKGSFLAAFDAKTGRELARVAR